MPQGTLRKWDDQRGFGFIRPDNGDADVFAHISAFKAGLRPILGDTLNYQVEQDQKTGKPRAAKIVIQGRAYPAPSASAPARIPLRFTWSPAVLLAVVLTLFVLAGAALFLLRTHNPLPLLAYVAASFMAFMFYVYDKYRAIKGQWRVPEATLHVIEILGGWPGAFIAQRTIRHKTVKLSYQVVFWIIVSLHTGLWAQWLFAERSVLGTFL